MSSPSLSSSATPLADSTSSPTSTQTQSGNGGPSSSLYLFTFLATLFLLLFVSSAIILRSFILRRRFRRRVEEAILAGVIQPDNAMHHHGRGRRRRAIGEKPKLWEAHVRPAVDDGWDAIVPVSVRPSIGATTTTPGDYPSANANVDANDDERPAAGAASPGPLPLSPAAAHGLPRPPHRRLWLRSPFSRRRAAGPPSPSSVSPLPVPMTLDPSLAHQNTPPSSSKTHLPTRDRLQVTVLIAMPDPRRPHPDGTALGGHHSKGKEKNLELDGDEEDLPEMALGMTELHYQDSITT
ncbi:hypothetical protein BC827DRAFT_1161153 [Russula dissimulans]|nr:hypothetical protein BC827DRAFT_1161153 [Russula dissimulans]